MAVRTRIADISVASDRIDLGSRLIALCGVAIFAYGLAFVVIDLTSFTEFGLTAPQVGGQPSAISLVSPALYNYISHLQVALSAFVMALAIQVTALAWFGVRRGEAGFSRHGVASSRWKSTGGRNSAHDRTIP